MLRRRGGWLKIVAPERPNGRPGWIRAGAGQARRRRRLDPRRPLGPPADRHAATAACCGACRVAVGRPGTETPTGRFAVTDKLRTGRADSPYGCCALALSGHQPKLLPGWPGGDRLAVHATPQPETVGTAASLGCLRAKTRDMHALMRIVPLGAPVFVAA